MINKIKNVLKRIFSKPKVKHISDMASSQPLEYTITEYYLDYRQVYGNITFHPTRDLMFEFNNIQQEALLRAYNDAIVYGQGSVKIETESSKRPYRRSR